jgi:hypothetical protein
VRAALRPQTARTQRYFGHQANGELPTMKLHQKPSLRPAAVDCAADTWGHTVRSTVMPSDLLPRLVVGQALSQLS